MGAPVVPPWFDLQGRTLGRHWEPLCSDQGTSLADPGLPPLANEEAALGPAQGRSRAPPLCRSYFGSSFCLKTGESGQAVPAYPLSPGNLSVRPLGSTPLTKKGPALWAGPVVPGDFPSFLLGLTALPARVPGSWPCWRSTCSPPPSGLGRR